MNPRPVHRLQRVLLSVVSWLTHARFAWQRQLAAYLAMVTIFIACVGLVQLNARADVTRDCRARRDGRQVLRELVVVSTEGGDVDYSAFPSFAELDPATKAFLIEVGQAQSGAGREEFRDRALAKLPPIVCHE